MPVDNVQGVSSINPFRDMQDCGGVAARNDSQQPSLFGGNNDGLKPPVPEGCKELGLG